MKRFSAFLSLLMLFGLAKTQVLWEKTWGGPYDDACEVHATRDGGIILLASYGPDSWIVKLDGLGDTTWSKRISLPLDFCSIVESDDGGFLTTGTTRSFHRDIFAWKLNSHGDSLWTRTYIDTTSSQGMYAVRKRPNGDFLVTGYTNANNYDMLALRLDSVGNLKWRKSYGTSNFEAGAMPSATPDGGEIFATTTGPSATPYVWVVRIDSLGDTLWTKNIVENLPTGGAIPLFTSDGRIFVLTWIEDNGNYDNHLICLDSLGNLQWTKTYPGIGFENRTAAGLIEDRIGGFTFQSSVDAGYGPASDRDMALFRLDSLGNVTRIHRVGHNKDDMPRYFDQMLNGDYVLTGWSESFVPTGQQTYLARLSPNGCGEFFYQMPGPIYDSICPNDSLLLDAGAGYSSYLWSDGDTNQIRFTTLGDTFSVIVTDSNGCLNYSNTVHVTALQGPSFSWTLSGPRTIAFDGNAGSSISPLNWDFGDLGTSVSEDPSHVYATQGSYWVCLSQDIPGCGIQQFCDTVLAIDFVANEPISLVGISAYPNPANAQLWLESKHENPIEVRMYDAQGKRLQSFKLNSNEKQLIQTSSMPSGIYHLQILQENSWIGSQKIILQH